MRRHPDPSSIAQIALAAMGLITLAAAASTIQSDDWSATRVALRDAPDAELVVRVGDIDNLGFGWPDGFDPFSGRETPTHPYPWEPEDDDPAGTDRIMLSTSFGEGAPGRRDGYALMTRRPDNAPESIRIEFALDGIEARSAQLQLFVDDFQAPVFGTVYEMHLDGERAPAMEAALNALEQTGPRGKLLTLEILAEQMHLLDDGVLEIFIDDTTSARGDGYAIDFVRLLVNPRRTANSGVIAGRVTDAATGQPLPGALVTAGGGVVEAVTDAEGAYRLEGVPAGLVVVEGGLAGYDGDSRPTDLIAGDSATVDLTLRPSEETSEAIGAALAESGRATLRGIYFDTDADVPRADSSATLEAVLRVMTDNDEQRYVIEGHTDAVGDTAYNRDLSRRRAGAVVAWLVERGIDAQRLEAAGYGEDRPVADNSTGAGRALNRRVEIVVSD